MADKNSIGRPKMFKSAKQMQKVIDEYFKECEGIPLKDENGDIALTKWGQPIIINSKPPTVTGLALALGFNSRQSLLNYQADEEFVDTITRAKARVEEYAETRLFDKDGSNGAKFSLANNFKGWTEKQEVTSNNTNLNTDLTNMDNTERQKRIEELLKKRNE